MSLAPRTVRPRWQSKRRPTSIVVIGERDYMHTVDSICRGRDGGRAARTGQCGTEGGGIYDMKESSRSIIMN